MNTNQCEKCKSEQHDLLVAGEALLAARVNSATAEEVAVLRDAYDRVLNEQTPHVDHYLEGHTTKEWRSVIAGYSIAWGWGAEQAEEETRYYDDEDIKHWLMYG